MKDLDPNIFMHNPVKRLELKSSNMSNNKYILSYEWNELGANYRLAQQMAKSRSRMQNHLKVSENQLA